MGTDLRSMMRAHLASGGIPAIQGRNGYAVCIEVIAERGPFGAKLVTGVDSYRKLYGDFKVGADGLDWVWNFCGEAGKQASIQIYANRIAHYAGGVLQAQKATGTYPTAAIAATAGAVLGSVVGPFDLSALIGGTLILKSEDAVDRTWTLAATRAARETTGGGTFDLVDAETLTVKIDGQATAQTVVFHTANFVNIAAATAAEVCAVINAGIVGGRATVTNTTKVTITSDKAGTGSHVQVTGGTANAVLGFVTDEVNGTGDCVDVTAVTVAEIKTKVEALGSGGHYAVTNVGGAVQIASTTLSGSSSILVEAASTLDAPLGLDNATHSGSASGTLSTLKLDGKTEGAYANAIKPRFLAPSDGVTGHFNLNIEVAGVIKEPWRNLSMDDTDTARYVVNVLNDPVRGSDLVTATDLDAATTAILAVPALGLGAAMTGGDDGLTNLGDNDFIGDPTAKTGLYAFNGVDPGDLLAVPSQPTAAVQLAMASYCLTQRDGKMYPIYDPPANLSPQDIVTWFVTTTGLIGSSQCGEVEYPRYQITNPAPDVFGPADLITCAPSAFVAGLIARTAAEAKAGKFENAAGKSKPFLTVRALEGEDTARQNKHPVCLPENQDLMAANRINYPRRDATGPWYLDNEDTMRAGSGSDFPTRNEQLGAQYVAKQVENVLDYVRHMGLANPTEDDSVQAECAHTVDVFLDELTVAGAFVSKDPELAYTADFGPGVNTPDVAKQDKMAGYVGLATKNCLKWGDITVARDTRKNDAAQSGS